jgi:seryl-tRNA synthetase
MKTIKQNELFQNLNGFLKSKGIELKDGSYSNRIRQGCNLLSDAINATQKTVKNAKGKVDQKLEQLRQSIHEATAPKTPPGSGQSKNRSQRKKAAKRKAP